MSAIEIPFGNFTLADGTPLAKFADGASATPGRTAEGAIRWNNHASPGEIVGLLPINAGTTYLPANLRIHAAKTGATSGDAVTFAVGIVALAQGAAYDAGSNLGGTSGAMTGNATAKTLQQVDLAVQLTLPANTKALAITLQPTAGTLGTDDLLLFRAFLETGYSN